MKSLNTALNLKKAWLGWVSIGSIVLLQSVSADTYNHKGSVSIAADPVTVDCQATLGSNGKTTSNAFNFSFTHLITSQTYGVTFTAPLFNLYDYGNCDYYVKVDPIVTLSGTTHGATMGAELAGGSVQITDNGPTPEVNTTLTVTTPPSLNAGPINATVRYTVYAVNEGAGVP